MELKILHRTIKINVVELHFEGNKNDASLIFPQLEALVI